MLFPTFLGFCAAWWGEPHKAVAWIGQKSLSAERITNLKKLLEFWKGEEGDIISIATWQDDIKGKGVSMMSSWHFTNEPVVDPEFTLDDYETTYNVSSIIADSLNSLFMESTTSIWAIAFHFRNLIHFVGDSHQPLHVSAGFSKDFPEGDRGGNAVTLENCTYGSPCRNLHMLWDSALLELQNDKIDQDYGEFELNVTRIRDSLDLSKESLADSLNPTIWVQDAHRKAADFAYGKLRNYVITEEYLAEGQKIADRLIALAGHRLGLIFNKYFDERGLIQITEGVPVPAREIVAWVIDGILLVVVAVYIFLVYKSHESANIRALAQRLTMP